MLTSGAMDAQTKAQRKFDEKRGSAHSLRLTADEEKAANRMKKRNETIPAYARRLIRERAAEQGIEVPDPPRLKRPAKARQG